MGWKANLGAANIYLSAFGDCVFYLWRKPAGEGRGRKALWNQNKHFTLPFFSLTAISLLTLIKISLRSCTWRVWDFFFFFLNSLLTIWQLLFCTVHSMLQDPAQLHHLQSLLLGKRGSNTPAAAHPAGISSNTTTTDIFHASLPPHTALQE